MPLVLSNSFHPKTCAASAGTSLLRRGGRAVIPKNIPFNRVRRAEVLQQCDGNAGQLWQYSTSKESLGVQDQSWYHCLMCPALHPLSLPPAPALLTVGRSPGANPSVLQGVEPDGLCLALLNSIILVLVCSTKELLFIDFSSWGLGKKGLRESHLFSGLFWIRDHAKYPSGRFTLLLQQGYRTIVSLKPCLPSMERGGKHLLGTVPSIITSIIDFIQPEERKSNYFLHGPWQGGVGNILQYRGVRMAVLVQSAWPSHLSSAVTTSRHLRKNREKRSWLVCDLNLSPGELPLLLNIREDFRSSRSLEGMGCRAGIFPSFTLFSIFLK